jgi:uncharacterized protein (TIGR03067 family)
MRGEGGTSRLAYTKEDYGSFRLIFTARMNPVNGDHLGVLFWGDRPKDSSKPTIDNAGWIQFMPPHGAMWDYHPPKHHNLKHETLAAGPKDYTQWSTTELLCDLEKGTMRAAVNGVEISRYAHPDPGERKDPEKRIVAGPIGLFRHGKGASEYKAIYVEANPKGDKLLTVPDGKVQGKEFSAEAKKELKKLEGKWRLVKAATGGKESDFKDKEAYFVFKGTEITLSSGTKTETLHVTALDPSTALKCIDLTERREGRPERTLEGVYAIDGDTLRIAHAMPKDGKSRPTSVEKPDDQALVWTLTRVKE